MFAFIIISSSLHLSHSFSRSLHLSHSLSPCGSRCLSFLHSAFSHAVTPSGETVPTQPTRHARLGLGWRACAGLGLQNYDVVTGLLFYAARWLGLLRWSSGEKCRHPMFFVCMRVCVCVCESAKFIKFIL